MSRIAFIDNAGSLASVAYATLGEGHEVKYLTVEGDETEKKIGVGLVDKVSKLKEITDWAPDCCVTYNAPDVVTKLEKAKIPHFGSSLEGKMLEDDRMAASALARRYGVGRRPRMFRFTKPEEAIKFVDSDEGRKPWVFKAEGIKAAVSSTHVSQTDEELKAYIQFESSRGAKGFVLQEFVDGLEISFEGWFDYRVGWLKPFNSTLEKKKLFSGDVGPMSGCMGSVVWSWPGDRPKLFRQTLERFTTHLKQIEYIGPFDVNSIIDYKTREPNFLEFTPRFGWDAFEAYATGWYGIGEFFIKLARGEAQKLPVSPGAFHGAVRIYTPAEAGVPLWAPLNDRRIWVKDVWKDEDQLLTTGSETCAGLTIVFEATAVGNTLKGTMSQIYDEVIPQLIVPDIAYRDDIGEQAERDIEMLEAWGYNVSG